ncbi:peptide-binding protein, partial [Streptomyces sp. WAC 06725]
VGVQPGDHVAFGSVGYILTQG